MTTTPTGQVIDVRHRIAEMQERYGPDHVGAEAAPFLISAADRLEADYFPNVSLAELSGVPVGFAGTAAGKLEMLFVNVDRHGSGIGSTLLEHASGTHDVAALDANEQNEQAIGLYLQAGFIVSGRSPVDGDGLPYPLLHTTLATKADQV